MTICKLKQYVNIQNEINSLYNKLYTLQNEMISDVVQGSYPDFPYTQHTIKIKGATHPERVENIKIKIANLEKLSNEIECYIEAIPDSRMRQIFTYKYLEGLSWQQVANKLNKLKGNYTSDSVRMAAKRFFEKI